MRFALPHAEQTALDHVEAVRLQIREQEEPPIFCRRQGAVLVHAKLTGGAGLPIEAPRRHMRLEYGLKGWDELLQLVERQARAIQELGGAGLHVGKPYTGHRGYLLGIGGTVYHKSR
jgi:hypothetical protein